MNDLIKIKKYYGEHMMHLCRDLFSTILEQENLLFNLLDSNFAHSRFLYEDIIENDMKNNFKEYIYSLLDIKDEIKDINKTPKELLADADYILYECHNEEDIQQFKKYYSPQEELCTFRGDRLESCYVFFAVKKNVSDIKRKDFVVPKRQDEYGTSVISIQFSRGNVNTLSIKNRYNHTVENPDATFSNNLENIIKGLTKSFEKEYNLNINQNNEYYFEIPGYVKANDGKFYKYNYEINNIYYCPYNIIIDNFKVKKYEPEKYLIIDYFVLDLINKKIYLYDTQEEDSFIDELESIKKIEIFKKNKNKLIKIISNNNEEAYIEIDKYNRINSYKNDNITEVGINFLISLKYIKKLELSNVQKIGYYFLCHNNTLTEISLPNVKTIGEGFLYHNNILTEISLPNVIEIYDNFLCHNNTLTKISLPNVEVIRNGFLSGNNTLTEISLPNVIEIYDNFLCNNNTLTKISLPNVKVIEDNFLYHNNTLTEICLPNVEKIGKMFFWYNRSLTEVKLPKVKIIGSYFLTFNQSLIEITLPNIEIIDKRFLCHNQTLIEINLPNIEIIGDNFLRYNQKITEIDLPKIKEIGDGFLYSNYSLKKINIKTAEKIGNYFLHENIQLKEIDILPTVSIGTDFLPNNKRLRKKFQDSRRKFKVKIFEKNIKGV